MAQLIEWDNSSEHFYETGVDHCVLYLWDKENEKYNNGVAWNGIVSVSESPSGAEANPLYADNIKYLNLYSAEEFAATVEAYTYPDEFAKCDGSDEPITGMKIGQQERATFGLCYRTNIGNDTDGNDHGYKLHFIYGCKASPSEKAYQSINDSPEAITFSWEISSIPVNVTGFKPTSVVTVDSTKFTSTQQAEKLAALLTKIYGTKAVEASEGSASGTPEVPAYMPLPDEIYTTLGGTLPED